MVYCVQADLAFNSAKIRDDVLKILQPRVAAGTWGATVIAAAPLEAGAHGLRLEVRFTTRLLQTTLASLINATVVLARSPRAGSSLRLHDCRHDTGGLCTNLTTKVW